MLCRLPKALGMELHTRRSPTFFYLTASSQEDEECGWNATDLLWVKERGRCREVTLEEHGLTLWSVTASGDAEEQVL